MILSFLSNSSFLSDPPFEIKIIIVVIVLVVGFIGGLIIILWLKKNSIKTWGDLAQYHKNNEPQQNEIFTKLEKLAELNKAGIITDFEFQSQKAELLKRL